MPAFKSLPPSPELTEYVLAHAGEDGLLARLRAETEAVLGERSRMQVAADQGAFLRLMARLLKAERALEIGTFTGYSAICIARGLGPAGRLVACDVSEEWTAIARRYFAEAGLDDRIDLRLAPALETLGSLPADEPFDLVFIDADKTAYPEYWQQAMRLVRPGGVVLVDNVLYHGEVAGGPGGTRNPASVEAIRVTNDMILADDRVDSVILPLADGMTVAVRRDDG